MKNNNLKGLCVLTGIVVLVVSGCRFRKEVTITLPTGEDKLVEDGTKSDNTKDNKVYAQTIQVVEKEFDKEQFVKTFLGVSSVAEAERYKPKHSLGDYYYEKDETVVVYTRASEYGMVAYWNEHDGAADCYEAIVNTNNYLSSGLGSSLRRQCPEEELDTCTKEQAIEACSKYAQACGYGEEADISVYAFTLDIINEINKEWDNSISAPGEGFEVVTRGQIEELRDEGKDEEADKLYDKLNSATERGLPWKKEHEAILLYYRQKLDGVKIDSQSAGLRILYVPYTNKVVLINGYTPYEQASVLETTELISEERAVSQVIQELGIRSQQDIDINQISMIYAIQLKDGNAYAVPAWKVDYLLKNVDEDTMSGDTGSIRIDAVSGFVSDLWKQE